MVGKSSRAQCKEGCRVGAIVRGAAVSGNRLRPQGRIDLTINDIRDVGSVAHISMVIRDYFAARTRESGDVLRSGMPT
jgi:hypothetical protein